MEGFVRVGEGVEGVVPVACGGEGGEGGEVGGGGGKGVHCWGFGGGVGGLVVLRRVGEWVGGRGLLSNIMGCVTF